MHLVINVLLVAVGGALGALLRYGMSGFVTHWMAAHQAFGTFAANVIGSFLVGFVWSASERLPVDPRFSLLMLVGILGAFTTFSTFALEGFLLLKDGQLRLGLTYIVVSNFVAIGFVLLGAYSGRAWFDQSVI